MVKPNFDEINNTRSIINPGNALVGPGLQAPMGDSKIIAVNVYQLPHPLSCYHQAYALDIEADGSTGTLRVPGQLNRISIHSAGSCLLIDISQPSQSEH